MFCQPLVYLQPGGEHNTFRGVGLPVVQLIHGFSGFLGASCFKKQKDFTGLAIKMLELSTGIKSCQLQDKEQRSCCLQEARTG